MFVHVCTRLYMFIPMFLKKIPHSLQFPIRVYSIYKNLLVVNTALRIATLMGASRIFCLPAWQGILRQADELLQAIVIFGEKSINLTVLK